MGPLFALLLSLPLLGVGAPAPTEVDCDRDGATETLTVVGGQLRFAGGPPQSIPPGVAPVVAAPLASGALVVCRIDLKSEALLYRKVAGAWALWLRLPAGPSADGERRIELALDQGALVRWETSAETRRCDGEARLFYARYDESAARFVPAPLPFPTGGSLPLQPAVRRGARSAYRIVAASAQLGVDEGADRLAPPTELADDDRGTAWRWQTPRGLAWLTARRTVGKAPLQAIEIDLLASDRPARVALLVDGQPAQTATIPPRGETIRLPLPALATPTCVSLVFEGVDDHPLAVAGVRLYDGGAEGLGGQLDEYLRGELAVATAARLATQPGFEAALRERMLAATAAPERRKLIELAVRVGPRLPIATRCALWRGATDADRGLLALLLAKDGAAEACLLETLADRTQPEPTLIEAARLLGNLDRPDVVLALRRRFPSTPALDAALAAALRELVGRAPALQAVLLQDLATKELPLVYYVVQRLPALDPVTRTQLAGSLRQFEGLSFDTEFLLLDALAAHPLDGTAPLLRRITTAATTDPVLAWRAARALGGHRDDESVALLQQLQASPLPRVRLAALAALLQQKRAQPDAVVKLLDDRWPEVQQQSAAALGALCPATPTLRETIAERLRGRRAALPAALELASSYLQCPGDPLPLLSALLDDPRQPPELRARVVVELVRRATPATPDQIARTLSTILDDPSADERQVELLLALVQGLGRLGKTSLPVERALAAALREPSLPSLRAAAYEAVAAICPPDGPLVLERGASDPQPEVAAAVRRLRATCPRSR